MLPQPPELDAVLRRGSFSLDTYVSLYPQVTDCQSGNVFCIIDLPDDNFSYGVHSPLHPARGMDTLPPLPIVPPENDTLFTFDMLLISNGGDAPPYFLSVWLFNLALKASFHVYMLQDDVWRIHASAITTTRQVISYLKKPNILCMEDRIYFSGPLNRILVLDLASSSFSSFELPRQLVNNGDIRLSWANGFSVYLVHVQNLQLHIWLRKEGNVSADDWLLVDTIFLGDMCAKLRMPTSCIGHKHTPMVRLMEVGDNAELVVLLMDNCLLYLDVRGRELRKAYEVTDGDLSRTVISPFVMAWPPVFPELKD